MIMGNAMTNDARQPDTITKYYPAALVVVVLLVAWISSFGYRHYTRPTVPELDANTKAYALLLEGTRSGVFSEAIPLFKRAHSIADDPDIRFMSDWLIRAASMNLKIGIETAEETSSFSGAMKGFARGFFDPITSLESLGLTIESIFTDADAVWERLDERYLSTWLNYLRMKQESENSSNKFWVVFIIVASIGLWLGFANRTGIEKFICELNAQVDSGNVAEENRS